MLLTYFFETCSELSVEEIMLQAVSSRDHDPLFSQRPSSHGCVGGGRLRDYQCHTCPKGPVLFYLLESTLSFLLFKCQFN